MPISRRTNVTTITLAALPDVFQMLTVLAWWRLELGTPHRYAPEVTVGASAKVGVVDPGSARPTVSSSAVTLGTHAGAVTHLARL